MSYQLSMAGIIDDDEIYQLVMRRTIEQSGAIGSVLQFYDGEEALNYFREKRDTPEGLPNLILLDINNVHVSAHNHGFHALDYLDGLPAARVQQFHLAGHEQGASLLIDTHDAPVTDAVWRLYEEAVRRFGRVSTMIERDDHIPPLEVLRAELDHARRLADALLQEAA